MKTVHTKGIGSKILGGFVLLIIIGLLVGTAGYWSLDSVIRASDIDRAAREVQVKVLECRGFEKDFILRRDSQSYEKLMKAIDELNTLTAGLKTLIDNGGAAEEIARAAEVYRSAATRLKALEEADATTLKNLQAGAARIATLAEEESRKVQEDTKKSIVDSNSKALKDNALKRIKGIVQVGHDVLKYHHDRSLSFETALDAIRNMHFDGDNYYFVVGDNLTLVAHGVDTGLEGKDFGAIHDKNGKYFMKEVVSGAIEKGESYTEYQWAKPGMGEAVFPKITYAKYFEPWKLIICAGVYIDDIEAEIAKTGDLISAGFKKLEEANAINLYALNARLNAVYYFAFEQNAEKVGENIQRLKGLNQATDALKKEADAYLAGFSKRVADNTQRYQERKKIDEIAGGANTAASGVSATARTSVSDSAAQGKTFILTFIIAGALFGILVAILLLRSITRPIRRVVQGIETAAEQVAAASTQISGASHQLADGASEQASSIEETSSSLEQMSTMTKQNADNATQANRLMVGTRDTVTRASQSMEQLTASMTEISKASEETSKIIRTIDEIAFQTNLLALNAAVEAARAGEAGAGFAVVADEVRNLAMRAADAAKSTADLIEGTVQRVKEGAEIVEKTEKEFREVAVSVEKSSGLVGEITMASQEQAQGIDQVNRAVGEMDKVVQQNASNAEQSASSSEMMNAQAKRMKEHVAELRSLVDGGKGGAAALRPEPAPEKIVEKKNLQRPVAQRSAPNRAGKTDRASANGAAKRAVKVPVPNGKKVPRPEQVIPFDGEISDF
ncbi:MAG: methyl-accepting chemotaxis protein [Syntrophobacter sp.]